MKKYMVFVSIAVFVMAFVLAGCGNVAEKVGEKVGEKVNEAVTEKLGSTADANEPVVSAEIDDEMYVEVYARSIVIADKYAQKSEDVDPVTAGKLAVQMTNELKNLYNQYGITKEAFAAYGDKWAEQYKENPTVYAEFLKKVEARVEELKGE